MDEWWCGRRRRWRQSRSVSTSISPTVGRARQCNQVVAATDRVQHAHLGHRLQDAHHGRHLLGPHGEHDVGADAQRSLSSSRRTVYPRITPSAFEPRNPILHRGPRQAQLSRDLRGGGPRILAQQGQAGLRRHPSFSFRRMLTSANRRNSPGRSGHESSLPNVQKPRIMPDSVRPRRFSGETAMNLIDKLAAAARAWRHQADPRPGRRHRAATGSIAPRSGAGDRMPPPAGLRAPCERLPGACWTWTKTRRCARCRPVSSISTPRTR
jgi:hypothetical protein